MHPLAAASSTVSGGLWGYVAIFALVAVGWAGVPAIGGAVVAGAAVLASQGSLDIAGVKMKLSQFAVWNFLAGAVYVLSVGPSAYGVGKVSSGDSSAGDVGWLIAGLAVAAAAVLLGTAYHRRRKARRSRVAAAHPDSAETTDLTGSAGRPPAPAVAGRAGPDGCQQHLSGEQSPQIRDIPPAPNYDRG